MHKQQQGESTPLSQPRKRAQTYQSRVTKHRLCVEPILRGDLPTRIWEDSQPYAAFYTVKNTDTEGVVFFYLGKGHPEAPREIVAWYPNGEMWASFGTNIPDAIEGAQRNGWMYAR